MAWRRLGDRPLSEPMLTRLTDACIRHWGAGWVKTEPRKRRYVKNDVDFLPIPHNRRHPPWLAHKGVIWRACCEFLMFAKWCYIIGPRYNGSDSIIGKMCISNNSARDKWGKIIHLLPCDTPDSKVHGANMGPIWGRQGPGGPHVGPMNFAIWDGSTGMCRSELQNELYDGSLSALTVIIQDMSSYHRIAHYVCNQSQYCFVPVV